MATAKTASGRRSRSSGAASRSSRSRRKPRTIEPDVEEELTEEELEAELEEDEPEDDPEEKPAPKKRTRKPRAARGASAKRKKVEPEPEPEDDGDEPEAPAPKRKPRTRSGAAGRSRKRRAPPAEEVEEAPAKARRSKSRRRAETEDVVEEVVDHSMEEEDFARLLVTVLQRGEELVIRMTNTGDYVLRSASAVKQVKAAKKGRRTKLMTMADWHAIIFTTEFNEHQLWWKELSFEEKVKEAEGEGVTWERHSTPRVDNMRCTQAYREAFDIVKFNPGYDDKATREAILYGED